MKFYHIIILSIVAILVSGCNGQSNTKAVVYVDLTAVAKALGRNEVINKQMAAAEKNVNEQLSVIAADLNKQVEIKKKELKSKSKSKSKKNDNKDGSQFEKQALQVMRNKKLEAQTKINQLKVNLLNKFRDEVNAAAKPIAKAVGAKTIMAVNANILWFDPELDITADVIDKMRVKK